MNDTTLNDIRWNNKPALIRSTIIGLFFICVLIPIGERAKPPEGYEFARLPSVTGVYRCCDAGGRASVSWVGNVIALCNDFTYFPFTGYRWKDCGYRDELNGQLVTIERVELPVFNAGYSKEVVVELKALGKEYFRYTDQEIRKRWIYQMRQGISSYVLWIVLIFHCAQLIYLNRKFNRGISK